MFNSNNTKNQNSSWQNTNNGLKQQVSSKVGGNSEKNFQPAQFGVYSDKMRSSYTYKSDNVDTTPCRDTGTRILGQSDELNVNVFRASGKSNLSY